MAALNLCSRLNFYFYAVIAVIYVSACSRTPEASFLSDSGKSYGDLAGEALPGLLRTVQSGVAAIDKDTMPHEIKNFRKEIGKLRDFLDIFVYAFPVDSGADHWITSRNVLDTGYEDVGHFKDLFDMQGLTLATQDPETGKWSEGTRPDDLVYDAEEVAELRGKVLAWQEEFREQLINSGVYSRLASPNRTKLHARKKQHLSRFFWGAVAIEPKASLSGQDNLIRLARHLLDEAKANSKDVLKINSLAEDTSAVEFHDFRKLIRSVTKLVAYFPQIDGDSAEADELNSYFTSLVDGYGEINDLIVARNHQLANDKKKAAKKLAKKIDELWDDLRKQQKQDEISKTIESYRDLIRDAANN